jgi:hypothetical protein
MSWYKYQNSSINIFRGKFLKITNLNCLFRKDFILYVIILCLNTFSSHPIVFEWNCDIENKILPKQTVEVGDLQEFSSKDIDATILIFVPWHMLVIKIKTNPWYKKRDYSTIIQKLRTSNHNKIIIGNNFKKEGYLREKKYSFIIIAFVTSSWVYIVASHWRKKLCMSVIVQSRQPTV